MKKDRLYFFTFLSISIIFLLIASLSLKYFIKTSANQLIEVQLESSKREANEIASLIHFQHLNGTEKSKIIQNLQETIANTNNQTWFICLFDWSGKEVCHPDITKIGQKVNSNQQLLNSLNENNNSDALYELLVNQEHHVNSDESEIVYIVPVKNSDLIVAAHVNLGKMSLQAQTLKSSFYNIFILMGIVIILASFFAVRMIGSHYEKQLELKNINLESELVNLSKLNTDLVSYKEKFVEERKESVSETANDANKKRILTYVRNELVSIPTEDIAYVFTENTITYVVDVTGKRSTSNMSLDDLCANLNTSLFFRANRQFIISITAIEKIIKYGNSQLKILMQSDSSVEIIISKNKAAEFKQWLHS